MLKFTSVTASACGFALTTIALGQTPPPAATNTPPQSQQPAATPALPGVDAPPSSSLLVTTPVTHNPRNEKDYSPHALRDVSMFAIAPPEPVEFVVHDLVQIIVRETSTAKSSSELETKKDSSYDAAVTDWPLYGWADFIYANGDDLPEFGVEFTKDFKGEGDYARKDDLSLRITAEVIEVLPNGNLVLEARTYIKTDREEQSMKLTGICRPDDITALNTIMSNQIHDLVVEKVQKGDLKSAAKPGLFTQVLDALFAF